jgi:AAA+ superfamily predicted ATPase
MHGKEFVPSAYLYVKSPEFLSKWVGETEADIREQFERGRKHFGNTATRVYWYLMRLMR